MKVRSRASGMLVCILLALSVLSAMAGQVRGAPGAPGATTTIDGRCLMSTFGPKGNPKASNLFGVIRHLQEQEGRNPGVKALKVVKGAA